MPNARVPHASPRNVRRLIGWLISAPMWAKITNFSPVAWTIRGITKRVVRQQLDSSPASTLSTLSNPRVAHADLESTLQAIVTDVVETLGYVGAIVAIYEPDGALPVRAWGIDSSIASMQQVRDWEAQISRLNNDGSTSLTDPAIARVYVDRPEYRANLSVQAFRQERPVASADLFDLFRPVLTERARIAIRSVQKALGVQQVLAVPFFMETQINGATSREFVGNLFALSRCVITASDQQVLAAFGRQAAASILSDRRRTHTQAVLRLIFDIQSNLSNESQILQQIVRGVVTHLGYTAAMVATYELDDSLPVRAWYVDPSIASEQQILAWEAQVSRLSPDRPISLTDPEIARVYVDDPAYSANLSVRAFKHQGPVTSHTMFDLFQPVIQDSAVPVIEGIQAALNVRQVIAVPFFFDAPESVSGSKHVFVGNLFAMSRAPSFSGTEIEMLQAFGQQAAAGLHNALLYERAENRRKAAEIFGKMAFNASASVHDLKNKLGIVSAHLQVLKLLPVEQLPVVLNDLTEPVFRNLRQMTDTLDTLHEPWQQMRDTPININACLQKALADVMPDSELRDVHVQRALDVALPPFSSSHDMMVEAFKVIIKNAVEAMSEKGDDGRLCLTTASPTNATIHVSISDNGIGIRPEHLGKIFDMSWSTKNGAGLGFGLFWTRDYIEGLGGTISVKSTYGEGTTFQIALPVTVRQIDDVSDD